MENNMENQAASPQLPSQSILEELSSVLQNLSQRLQNLESRSPLAHDHAPLLFQSPPQSFSPGAAPKVSLPEKFAGSISRFRDFIASVENIFALQPHRYPQDEVKTRFIGTLLVGDALSWFRDLVEQFPEQLRDYEVFKSEFKAMFDDPNATRHACDQLARLSQGSGSVSHYSLKFRRLAAQTGYNEAALRHFFRKGLHGKVKDVLSHTQEEPANLEEFIRFCIKIDHRLFDRKMEQKNENHYEPPVFKPSQNAAFKSAGPTPMDLDVMQSETQKAKFKKLTKQEKQRRADNNLCLYCASDKHQLPDCFITKKSSLNIVEFVSVSLASSEPQDSPRLQVKLSTSGAFGTSKALIDSGANANFLSLEFFEKNVFGPNLNPTSDDSVKMADGSVKRAIGFIKNVFVEVLGSNSKTLQKFMVVEGIKYSVILGVPWLRSANPHINWKVMDITFKESQDGVPRTNSNMKGDLVKEKECSSNFSSTVLNNSEKMTGAPDKSNAAINSSVLMKGDSLKEKECSSNSPSTCLTNRQTLPDGIPKVYAEFASVFYDNEISQLPPERSFDLEIQLKDPSKEPPFLKIYALSFKEEGILKDWIKENLQKGFIRPSKSPSAAPIFFVKKKDSSLRPCIDYRILNSNTVKDRHPLPLVSEILNRFSRAKFFSQIDLKGAYNLVRIKKGHESKAAFRCKFGHFEPCVVQFGLTNAPAVFQRFINSIFQDLIDICVVIYLDDILIFSDNLESHITHVKEVFKRLKSNNLVAKASKCFFHSDRLTFLGHVISPDGIRMDNSKVDAIRNVPPPKNLKDLRSFLGLANYYRKFIKSFSSLAYPLTTLTRKDVSFNWTKEVDNSFNAIKDAICNDVLLTHPKMDQQFFVFTDASKFAIGAVLTQKSAEYYRPIEFFSRKLSPAEINYAVYDRELLAIIEAFTQWRHYLIHSPELVQVFSDHNNLRYFRSNQLLKPRHARWAEFLGQFSFRISHIIGQKNVIADCLSRNPDYDMGDSNDKEVLLPETNFKLNALEDSTPDEQNSTRSETAESVRNLETTHDFPEDIALYLDSENNSWPCTTHAFSTCKSLIKNFSLIGDKLYYDTDGWKRLYLPKAQRLEVFRKFHDNLGHLATDSILDLVRRRYYWPNLEKELRDYCFNCSKCELARGRGRVNHVPIPPIRPIPPAAVPFERIGLDFMSNLPLTRKNNRHLITCIDYATRWVIVEPIEEMKADLVIKFLYSKVLTQFGCPFEIITDRGSQFTSEVFAQFMNLNQIRHLLTSPYHPQTNGMVERMHGMINHGIKTMTVSHPDRWDEFLDQVLFGIRTRTHSTTRNSPFFLLYGYHPRFSGDLTPPRQVQEELTENELEQARKLATAERLENLGQFRAAAYHRSLLQAQKMKERDVNANQEDYFFEIGQMVKLKHFGKTKFEFSWRGPYIIRDLGFPGTYWLMRPDGSMLDSTVSQTHLAPWLSDTQDNIDYFYDGRIGGRENTVDTQGFLDDTGYLGT